MRRCFAKMLRRDATIAGTRGDLAKMLTDDLQAVHKDGHLHVMLARARRCVPGRKSMARCPQNLPPLIQSAKTIAPGIGYIRFTGFFGTDEEMAAVRKWLADNRDAKTLIFDLRNHHGGGLDEQDAIFSYLFDRPTPLVRMAVAKSLYSQGASPLRPRPTLLVATEGDKAVGTHTAIPGEDTPLRKAKVYLLTSNRTGSAAEHFALAMKSTGRGTLIGEATAGANHFGGPCRSMIISRCGCRSGAPTTSRPARIGKATAWRRISPSIPSRPWYSRSKKQGLSHEEAVRLDAAEVPAEPVHRDKLRAR